MASPAAQQPSSTTGWSVFSAVTSVVKTVGESVKWAVGYQEPVNALQRFPDHKPVQIAIKEFSSITPCNSVPSSYVAVKKHVLEHLEAAKEEESAENAAHLDLVRRAVINQGKTCLEDDDMAGFTLHLQNFDDSFSEFPGQQLRDSWDKFASACPEVCNQCQKFLDYGDIPGLIGKTDELKEVFTDLPGEELYINWPRFIKWRQKELTQCHEFLGQNRIKELADYVRLHKLFAIGNPGSLSARQWQQDLADRQNYLNHCSALLGQGAPGQPSPDKITPQQLADAIEYATEHSWLYPEFPGHTLAAEWEGFIARRLKSIAKPVTSDKRFEALFLDLPRCEGYKEMVWELELEMHRWQENLLRENKDPNDPQVQALQHCAELLSAGEFESLMFEVRNYNFCFNPLFPNFPFEKLQEAYLKSQNQSVEEYAPQNLGELKTRFLHMSRNYASDMDRKTKQFNPNSRVFSQIMATRYLGENQMENFVYLYRRSQWLQAVFPKEFLPCIVATHETNTVYDQALPELMAYLNGTIKGAATDRIVSTANACLMQKNAELWSFIDVTLADKHSELMAEKDQEEAAAREQQRPLRWSQVADKQITAAILARRIFADGNWQQLDQHLKTYLPELHTEMQAKLKELLEDSRVDEFLYWPRVVASRAVMTYKNCKAKGTDEDFLAMCQPNPDNIPYDHWTMRLKRGEFSELHTALQEAYSYEPGVTERIEAAFTRYMPQKQN